MREIEGISYFHSTTVAKVFQEVAVDSVKTSSGMLLSRWYQAGQIASLNLWTTPDGVVVRQKLELLGQLVIWDKDNGIRTGLLVDNEVSGETAEFDPGINMYSLKWAHEIVTLAEAIPESFKKQIIKNWSVSKKKTNVLSLFGVGKKKS